MIALVFLFGVFLGSCLLPLTCATMAWWIERGQREPAPVASRTTSFWRRRGQAT